MPGEHDELGVKVQRAQHALSQIRATATVDGITVEVDAQNQILAISGPLGNTILTAYRQALESIHPQVTEAMRELHADPKVESTMAFTAANPATLEAARLDRAEAEVDNYFERSW
ncbi:YbaB/EbfC family nucleoid-associated protein [Nocardia sp. NPDC058058]|uniref:YbaB/EbfC family nucleoid-associated protein n=1 Tax=Nocardia sp. NPDC058058 TaxID=3346317 RepID=UPI0036D76FE5